MEYHARTKRPILLLAGVCIVFLLVRSPIIFRQLPAQDEDFFAVPGWTILNEGIPRIPYVPARNDNSAFFGSDQLLFALPPLYFYWQAMFYAVLGPSTGVARLSSAVAAVIAIVTVFLLVRKLLHDDRAALWSAGMYAFSRVVYFPCINARPDMLCGALGLICILFTCRYTQSRRTSDVVVAGVSGGLGMLTHPFALLYCLQAGVWLLLATPGWKPRLRAALLFVIPALLAFSLWGILIVQAPDLFHRQFSNNVFSKSGPGFFSRLIWPFPAIIGQAMQYYERAGPVQAMVCSAGVLIVSALACRQKGQKWRVLAALAVSGSYLHMAISGRHYSQSYWCYAGALQFMCVGAVVSLGFHALEQRFSLATRRVVKAAAVLVVIALFMPGSGVRTLVAHVRHWNNINYNAPAFTRRMMKSIPREHALLVDPGYIFDFHRAGYRVLLASRWDFYFDAKGYEYDYVIGGPSSIRYGFPDHVGAVPMFEMGDSRDLFACHAVIYRNPSQPELELRR